MKRMIPISRLRAPQHDDPRSLYSIAKRAERFVEGHTWCKSIKKAMLDIGWDGILGVFFFEIEPVQEGFDSTFWVIAGDLPTARICNDNPNGPSALDGYVREMQKWVDATRHGHSVENLIPVNVPPSREYAEMLQSRLDFIRDKLLPDYLSEVTDRPIV
jgi:hypothetical protein